MIEAIDRALTQACTDLERMESHTGPAAEKIRTELETEFALAVVDLVVARALTQQALTNQVSKNSVSSKPLPQPLQQTVVTPSVPAPAEPSTICELPAVKNIKQWFRDGAKRIEQLPAEIHKKGPQVVDILDRGTERINNAIKQADQQMRNQCKEWDKAPWAMELDTFFKSKGWF
jgi:hypothetical protein